MKTISKAIVGTVAAGAMAMTSAAPAFARDNNRGGPSAGEVIAGAVILGGIAAVLTSGNNRGDRYDDRRYDDRRGYNDQRGNSRAAIQRCIQVAEQDAYRAGFRGADVTQIRDVDRTRSGWRVKGRIAVQEGRGYNQRARYDRNDRRGYRNNVDNGKFTCDISRGRVVDLDFSGIRGLR